MRRRISVSILGLVLTLMLATPASAQLDSLGTDFWLGFMHNHTGAASLPLFITGPTATNGTVEVPGLGFSQNFSVTPGTVTTVDVPVGAEVRTSDAVQDKGIHVTANDPVTVYGLNRLGFTTDAFLGLPTDVLGTEYITLGFGNVNIVNKTEFMVVAAVDGTTVSITPSVTTGPRVGGTPYNITLQQGEAYLLQNTVNGDDLSGSFITSDQPIAVYGGHGCANIPSGSYVACDHIVEQLPPTNTWGTQFVTAPLATRLNGDTFRFLAGTDNTSVSVNGANVATLNRGQFHQMIINGPSTISASAPILVAQYSNCTSYDGVTSDPFMMLIPPFEQFLGGYTITTPASGFSINFASVVAPTSAVGSVLFDGAPIAPGDFTVIGTSAFSYAHVSLTLGSHTFSAPQAFGVFTYGFDSADSYGYPGGLSLAPVAVVASLVMTPETINSPVGQQVCLDALVRDQNSNPVQGVRVDFAVTGVNPTNGFAFTNASGIAQFCYTGNNAGTDTVTATVGGLNDTSQVFWGGTAPTPTPTVPPATPTPPTPVPTSSPGGLALFVALLAAAGVFLMLRRSS